MIKANELRLGNWVSITGTNIQLAGEKFLYILAEDGIITRCDPIPLTPEILEKAGFEKKNKSFYKQSTSFEWFVITTASRGRFYLKGANIEYLHQLQNLYFALTGQELEINL